MQEFQQSKPIEESIRILEENLADITTVSVWAKEMGYSRSYFSTRFTEYFGESPSECLCRIRYCRLHRAILQYPYETSRAMALRLGLRNEQALYKFLSRHYDTNFTEVRNKLLGEDR